MSNSGPPEALKISQKKARSRRSIIEDIKAQLKAMQGDAGHKVAGD